MVLETAECSPRLHLYECFYWRTKNCNYFTASLSNDGRLYTWLVDVLMRGLGCGGGKKWRRNGVKIGQSSSVLGGRRPPRRIKAHSATPSDKVRTTIYASPRHYAHGWLRPAVGSMKWLPCLLIVIFRYRRSRSRRKSAWALAESFNIGTKRRKSPTSACQGIRTPLLDIVERFSPSWYVFDGGDRR